MRVLAHEDAPPKAVIIPLARPPPLALEQVQVGPLAKLAREMRHPSSKPFPEASITPAAPDKAGRMVFSLKPPFYAAADKRKRA